MDWTTLGEIFGIFSGIVAGGWILAVVLGRAMRDKWTNDGEHNQIHVDIAEDVHAAHESLRRHDTRLNALEATTSEISGKLDQSLKNQQIMLNKLMSNN
jgi:hypothetical protein